MSDPRWHDADPSVPPSARGSRPPRAPGRYPGMRDTSPPDLREQTRRMPVPPELRGRRGPGGPPNGGSMRGRGRGAPGILGEFGNFTGLAGIGIVAASALVGAVITVGLRRDPGAPLGVLVIIGTLVAGLAVRARSARLLIPAPTLCYL